jgi:hypothetical protein
VVIRKGSAQDAIGAVIDAGRPSSDLDAAIDVPLIYWS